MVWSYIDYYGLSSGRAKPVMIDPGLHSLEKSDIVWANEQRALPTAFKLYTGTLLIINLYFIQNKNVNYNFIYIWHLHLPLTFKRAVSSNKPVILICYLGSVGLKNGKIYK